MLPLVFLTALAVGGATMLGALGGYCFRGAADRAGGQTVMAFAAGMMLSAAVAGLILPSLAGGGPWAFPVTAAGILSGAAFLLLLERLAAQDAAPFRTGGWCLAPDPAGAAVCSRHGHS